MGSSSKCSASTLVATNIENLVFFIDYPFYMRDYALGTIDVMLDTQQNLCLYAWHGSRSGARL
jgi:hypothetical protein